MCRMLVAFGDFDVSKILDAAIAMASDLTSDHEFNQDGGRGTWKHDDGWGISYLKDGEWKFFRSTSPIHSDSSINQFRKLKTSYLMLHIRRRMGSETHIHNTHPFQMSRSDFGDYVFCHNGYAGEDFTYSSSLVPVGKTDSERLFYNILTMMQKNSIANSIQTTLSNCNTPTGSNVILSSKKKTHVTIHKNSFPKYYQMQIGSSESAVIISSEILFYHEDFLWVPLPKEGVISIDHQTLELNNSNSSPKKKSNDSNCALPSFKSKISSSSSSSSKKCGELAELTELNKLKKPSTEAAFTENTISN